MGSRASSVTFRMTPEEREALEAHRQGLPDAPTLSEAIRGLILAGLRASHPRPLTDLKAVLRELDPAWTGRRPALGPPVRVRPAGPLRDLLDAERAR